MRVLTLVLAVFSTAAQSEDFTRVAPVTAATIFADGARVTRAVALDVPAGSHRILVPMTGGLTLDALVGIEAPDGVEVGSVSVLDGALRDPAAAYLPAQAEAEERIETARDVLEQARDARADAGARLIATQAE
ncbi:MAG: DUF4140 domain-containing protein, partial [Pseudomonadota bacterium]